MKGRIALILPCAPWVKYKGCINKVKTWNRILTLLEKKRLKRKVEVYAIDCIVLKSTGNPIGIWNPKKHNKIMNEILKYKLDSYPSWEKFKKNPNLFNRFQTIVKKHLINLSKKYDKIVAYVNVKAYYLALLKAKKFVSKRIIIYKFPYFSPFQFFKRKNIKNLFRILEQK